MDSEELVSYADHVACNKYEVKAGEGKEKLVEDLLLEQAFVEDHDGEKSGDKTKVPDDGEADQIWPIGHSGPIPGQDQMIL